MSIIYEKGDVPSNLIDEATEYSRLKFIVKTTTGAYSFTSGSSGQTYSGATGGTQQLFNDLSVVLEDHEVNATYLNAIRSLIYGDGVPVLNGINQKLNYSGDNISSWQVFQSDGITLISQDTLTYDGSNRISTSRRRVYDTDGTTIIADFTDTLTYNVDETINEISRVVTV